MRILAVDDELLQLEKLTESISAVVPDADIVSTRRPSQALYLAEEDPFDVAFLDIQMRGMTGLELAELIKRVSPRVNIIFVSAYNDFKADAMDLRASGYITKPVTPSKIREELLQLRYPISMMDSEKIGSIRQVPLQPVMDYTKKQDIVTILTDNRKKMSDGMAPTANQKNSPYAEEISSPKALLHIQCFGNFDVFDQDYKPIKFKRSRAKEMLAYLVSKKGSRCTSREIASVFYENMEYNKRIQDSFRHISSALVSALRDVGAESVILRDHQNYAIDITLVDCDYYRFIQGDPIAKKAYVGEFMYQYSWAEYMNAYLDSQLME